MFGSLRFRLPALFLLGIVLAGIVATAVSIRFFQNYTKARAIDELRSESVGIVQLYATQAGRQTVPRGELQVAIGGDRIFYAPVVPGAELFVGKLPVLSPSPIDVRRLESSGPITVRFTYQRTQYLSVASPLKLGPQLFGALVVAKPESQLRSRLLGLIERLAIAFGGSSTA